MQVYHSILHKRVIHIFSDSMPLVLRQVSRLVPFLLFFLLTSGNFILRKINRNERDNCRETQTASCPRSKKTFSFAS